MTPVIVLEMETPYVPNGVKIQIQGSAHEAATLAQVAREVRVVLMQPLALTKVDA